MEKIIKSDVVNDIILSIVMAVLAFFWILWTIDDINLLSHEAASCMLIGATITESFFSAHRAYRRSKENSAD